MAPLVPAEVADTFAAMDTDNASVIGDMINAAIAMPPSIAVSLIPRIVEAARHGRLWLYFTDACNLVAQLAEQGEPDAALRLADALFPAPSPTDIRQLRRRETYHYREGLKRLLVPLARTRARLFLPRLCGWLVACVKAKKYIDGDTGNDFSYTWRPAIERHEQNPEHDFASAVVGFVRTAFEEAIRHSCITLSDAISLLSPYRFLVFRRLELHLIGEFAEQEPELTRATILTRELFDDYQRKHEYAMLVGRHFHSLTDGQRTEWLGWVAGGPDLSGFDDYIRQNYGREPTDDDRTDRLEYWQFERLHWIRQHLDGTQQKFYDRMVTRHGEPHLADLNTYSGPMRWGNDSPMAVEDLASMGFDAAVEAATTWRPDQTPGRGPTRQGLATVFGQYVATNPTHFSGKASSMAGRPPVFVRAFLGQMAAAVKDAKDIDLHAVLKLCGWVGARPLTERDELVQEHEPLVDKDWQWCRDEISNLVQSVCTARSENAARYPPKDFREALWDLLVVLCRDRPDSYVVHDVAADDPRFHDYLSLGINSPRGKAVEAALEYARWVANSVMEVHDGRATVPGGMDVMPEIRDMLQWQIADENRTVPSLAVIGSRIDLLYWIDAEWLAQEATQLFNLRGIEGAPPDVAGWAAWNAFLVWVRPHREYSGLFAEQFDYAVRQAMTVGPSEGSPDDPMDHLGEHLMIYYAHGALGLDDDRNIIKRFLEQASPRVRRHAIGFVGKSLEGSGPIPPEILERFVTLWDNYWAGKGKSDAQHDPDDWLFGPWFACGCFDDAWALSRLEQFVEVVMLPEPDHAVAERLAAVAHTDVARAMRILSMMVRGDREGWQIRGWIDSARTILRLAMQAGGEARTKATEIIDHLGRRGYVELGELLKT